MPEENSTPWSGEGLPPPGLLVEWSEWQNGKFEKVTVIAYADGDAWIKPEKGVSKIVGNPAGFRPFLTTEQIAAEERESAVRHLMVLMAVSGEVGPCDEDKGMAEAIYDAGYRKQVTP